MKKNILIILLIIVIALLAFTVFRPKPSLENDIGPSPIGQTQTNDSADVPDYQSPTNPLLEKYSALLPSIRAVLKSNVDVSDHVGEERDISLEQEMDITGDGEPELLVDLGYGGATSDMLSIVKIDNNVPAVVKIKDRKGTITSFSFLSGSGGAGRYAFGVNMGKNNNSIKTTQYYVYGEASDFCQTNVFIWNPQTKLFEYNKIESDKGTKELMKACLDIALESGVKYQGK